MAVAYAIILILLTSSSSASSKSASGCYESIVSFGDSLADTGNQLLLSPSNKPPRAARPPYGRTFFHHPTGRSSDGRLVIDFIAQSLGLPLVQPYIGGENGHAHGRSFSKGVNFAVVGATALDYQFYEKIGIHNPATNVSLGTQLDWFKHFLATIPDGRKFLQRSLVLVGEIGGNDYNDPLMQGDTSAEVIQSFVPIVVDYIGSTIEELIKLGAETMLVPGNLPIGCLPVYLTEFEASSTVKDYDSKTGCLNWLNKFSRYHNELLQKELSRIRELHPHVAIIYADYYNAAMLFYLSPNEFGFTKGILRACCGAGGSYNYNASAPCGVPRATCCDDPSSFASWDGIHFTEAAYRLIAQGLLEGPYTTPDIRTICPSIARPAQVYDHKHANACFKSIVSFGDSLADTGNLIYISPPSNIPPNFALPPYGETFFHIPTEDSPMAASSSTSLVWLPFIPPFHGGKNMSSRNFRGDVNFTGVQIPSANVSLVAQLSWFKEIFLPTFCPNPAKCKNFLETSLILVGEIGGNDYNHAFLEGKTVDVVQSFIPEVVEAISLTINKLIKLGAVTLMVPGNFPIGCSAAYLTYFKSSNEKDYDPKTGCLNWPNRFSQYHNELLQLELNRIRQQNPNINMIMQTITKIWSLRACCGGGGPYNANFTVGCGFRESNTCEDPSLYAAYRWIATALLRQSFTIPQLNSTCALSSKINAAGFSDH
ncbi:hypothetical protein Pfo_012842 [Paulownia fortunei]|nr:hypothetical protein Pfo_012842 [Paulownia fortunei]